jgi:hypothetical protein
LRAQSGQLVVVFGEGAEHDTRGRVCSPFQMRASSGRLEILAVSKSLALKRNKFRATLAWENKKGAAGLAAPLKTRLQ